MTIAWVQLFVLSEETDRYFAWTIAPPLSAAFYGGAAVIGFQSGREREWSRARLAVPGVIAFTWLPLGATLLHLDKFHLDEGGTAARIAAWAWLLVYVLVPVALTVAFVLQWRNTGPLAAPTQGVVSRTQPAWYRALFVALGAVALVLGAALFAVPEDAADLWPWKLTPLVARAMSAWLVGFGLLLWAISREPDRSQLRAGLTGIAAIGVLQLVALLRYVDSVSWSAAASWLYVLYLLNLVGLGIYGWLAPARH